MNKSRKHTTPPSTPPRPSAGEPLTNPLRQGDLRWQRGVRFNWDNGGRKGGGHGGRR